MKSLAEAYREKYENLEVDDDDMCGEIQVYVPKSITAKGAPGFGLGGRLAMDNLHISTVGEVDDNLKETFKKVTELDLTKNSISDWSQIQEILLVMPNLELLNVSMNPLNDNTWSDMSTEYPRVKTLALNDTGVSWSVILQLLPKLPNLSELHLSVNKYLSVDLPDNFQHKSVANLYMNDSDICDWADIRRLGHAFPNLESLTVINTNIQCLSDSSVYTEFPVLTCLNISQCCLSSWDDIDRFRNFPKLDHLRISQVPFLEETEAKLRRQQLIARLPDLKKLNGSRILETEREDAERAFIRLYMDSHTPPHRYRELERRYGKLDPLAQVDLTPNNSMSLLVHYEDKSKIMEINLHQTVAQFKKHLEGFTGLPVNQQQLYYNEMFEGNFKDTTHLKIPNKTLLSLNINEGDEFSVFKKL